MAIVLWGWRYYNVILIPVIAISPNILTLFSWKKNFPSYNSKCHPKLFMGTSQVTMSLLTYNCLTPHYFVIHTISLIASLLLELFWENKKKKTFNKHIGTFFYRYKSQLKIPLLFLWKYDFIPEIYVILIKYRLYSSWNLRQWPNLGEFFMLHCEDFFSSYPITTFFKFKCEGWQQVSAIYIYLDI